jgi:peptidoglycan/LPS O-acetylase OafA/YrhL
VSKKQAFLLAVIVGSLALLMVIATLLGMTTGFQNESAIPIVVAGCVVVVAAAALAFRSRPSTWRHS